MSTLTPEILETHFDNAWQWLQQTKLNTTQGKQSANQLPWFLIIGPSNAGKTQLILQSGLKRFYPQPFAIDPKDEDSTNKHCNWWLTKEAIFLDIPGHYFDQEHKTLWQQITAILQKYIRRKSFHGIILTLDATEWVTQNKAAQQAQIQELKHALHTLIQFLKYPCPLYLVFTKLDQVSGFCEFFADLGKEERGRIWGFPVPASSNLPNTFKTQYERILKRLHERVIFRLHQERNPEKRILIQQFPAQAEILKNNLASFIYQFADSLSHFNKTPLQGVYFVSNLQQGVPVNFIEQHLTQTLNVGTPKNNPGIIPQPKYQQAYFSQQLFKKIIFNNVFPAAKKFTISNQNKTRLFTYASCALLLLGSSLWMTHAFNDKIKTINAAQTALTQYRLMAQQLPIGDRDLNQTLPTLAALRHAVDLVKQAKLPWLMVQGFHQPNPQFLVDQAYQRALINYFLPGLSNALEQLLNNESDPNVLYNALKIYLMLSDPARKDPQYIQQWLNNYWGQTLNANPILQQQFNNHLTALLSHPITPIVANQAIINKARITLKTISSTQLAYAILKSNYKSEWINPFISNNDSTSNFTQIFSNIAKIPGIPKFYTASLFSTIYFQQIPNTCLTVINGDWVMGKAARSDNLQLLTQTVQTLYLQEYGKHWQALLSSLRLTRWQNLISLQAGLNILSSKDSPLIFLLKTVQQNTAITKLAPFLTNATETDTQNIKTYLSDQFRPLNNLLLASASLKSSNMDLLLLSIQQLQDYLNPLEGTDTKSSFELAKKRFSDTAAMDPIRALLLQAKDMPLPIQIWLNAIADNSWRLVLDNTKQYLNQSWKTEVLNNYNKKINNRYPIFKHSDTDISLEDFKNFFAAQGILDQFFKNKLAPFIDMSKPDWQLRVVDGQSLNFTPPLLAQFERAGIIRAMFFNTNQQLNVDFFLRRTALGPNVKRFALIYNDQPYVELDNKSQTYQLTWPSKTNTINLAFTNEENRIITQSINGPWALFHLLDKAQLQAAQDTRHFELVFDANGYAARYQLFTNQLVNPFIPGIMDQFRCPEVL